MADNFGVREGTGKITIFRSVELEGGLHILVASLADENGNLLGTNDTPLPVTVKGGISIGDITVENVEISNDVGNPVPVSGPLTNSELRATDLPVTLDGESVAVTGPLTDAQLRASAVRVTLGDESIVIQSSALPAGAATSAKQDTLAALIGEVQASPTTYSLLERLKVLATLIGEVQASPTANTLQDRLKALAGLLAGGLPAALSSGGGVKVGVVDSLPSGINSIGAVASNSVVSSATITRPGDTNAYAAKDVISNSTSTPAVLEFAGMARANGGSGTIVRARLMTSQKTNIALYRLHLFHTAPTPTADNSPYTMLYANADKRIGAIDFPSLLTEDSTNSTGAAAMRPSYDGAYPPPNLWYKCAQNDTKLYGILETLSGFSPDNAQIYYVELGADGLN